MRVSIVTFPGSNCDYDLYKCIQLVGGTPEFRWHRERELGNVDAVMLPGGFSYGDYLRAGAIATMSPIMDSVKSFAEGGGPVVGICNGFQMLCEAGLLEGALLRNRQLLFASQDVHLRVAPTSSIFTGAYAEGQILRMPIAHAEGSYYADDETLDDEGLDTLEFTDGLNILTLNAYRRFPDAAYGLTPYVGGGLGVAVPRVEYDDGQGRTDEYQLTGPAVALMAGASYDVTDSVSVFGEYKGTYSQNEADLIGGGTLESDIVTNALNLGVSFNF